MSARRIIILGTGGNCIDILDTIWDLRDASGDDSLVCAGFLDDAPERWGTSVHGVPVLGPLASAGEYEDCVFINGIGSPRNFRSKEEIIARTALTADRFTTIVHPTASVSRTARLGPGTVLFQNVVVTTGVQIGAHVVVLPNSVVSHDCAVGDFTCITGGVSLSGGVRIGKSCYLGSNSTIRDGVAVRDYSLVGMGSVVLHDVPPNAVVAGNPARLLRTASPR